MTNQPPDPAHSAGQTAPPAAYSFPRYLAAKKSIDDRALNRAVWSHLQHSLAGLPAGRPLQVLEIGAGIGTMIERTLAWELLSSAEYLAIDAQPENIAWAGQRLPEWAAAHGWAAGRSEPRPSEQHAPWPAPVTRLVLACGASEVNVELQTIDLFDFLPACAGRRSWDLIIAHAFLDLVDIPQTLPGLFRLLRPGGLGYFTLNFDGATILEPTLEPGFDEQIERLYHQTMDTRLVNGQPSGDSRAGRHLFAHLKAAGAQILAAGASDWVVFAGPDGYPADEAYFLHFIVHTIEQALTGHPDLDPGRFSAWIARRHAQVQTGELVYLAHQLDFLCRLPGRAA